MTTRSRSLHKCRLLTSAAFGLLVTLSGLMLVGCSEKKTSFHAMDVTGAPWGQTYSLPDIHGKTVTPEQFKGKVTAVYFGFLYCPDACPTALTKLNAVKERLGKQADKLQIVFISVDPERDVPEKLGPYLKSFDPSIVGLRGSMEQTQAVAKDFRVFFKKVETKNSAKDPMAYTIDHTTFIYVFDPQATLRLVVPHELSEDKIAEDLRHLIN